MADQAVVRQWLTGLGSLTTGTMGQQEATTFLDNFAPMLASRFDGGAFTSASLEHVAAQCKYLPTYGELVPLLQCWWREHRPTPPAIAWQPAPEPVPERTPDELQHVSAVTKRILAELSRHEIETTARYRSPDAPTSRRDMTRAELNEAYRRAGLKGPHSPQPVDPEHVGHC